MMCQDVNVEGLEAYKNQNTAAGKRKIFSRRKSGQFVVNYNKLKHQQEAKYQPSLVDLSTDA